MRADQGMDFITFTGRWPWVGSDNWPTRVFLPSECSFPQGLWASGGVQRSLLPWFLQRPCWETWVLVACGSRWCEEGRVQMGAYSKERGTVCYIELQFVFLSFFCICVHTCRYACTCVCVCMYAPRVCVYVCTVCMCMCVYKICM